MSRQSPEILIIPGSNRAGSYNAKLAGAAAKELSLQGAEVTWISLNEFPLPLVNEDLLKEKGAPENAQKMARLFKAHDGVLLVSPEYNSSIPPLMKNMLDWVSLVKELGGEKIEPYANRAFAVSSASPGALGGIRMLPHLRGVLQNCGADVITPQLALGKANSAFDDSERLSDERTRDMFEKMCTALIERAKYFA